MEHDNYSKLVQVIEQMIEDKVQLIHGGHLMDWDDTKILDIIKTIKENEKSFINQEISAGTKLQNIVSKQEVNVINDVNGKISLIVQGDIITFPKDKIGKHYRIVDTMK